MKWLKDRLSLAKVWAIKQWGAFIVVQKNWIATYEKRAFLILLSVIIGLLSLWLVPKWQAYSYRERFDSLGLGKPERIQLEKDLIYAENNARVTIAQIIGGLVVLLGLYATFRNIETARENLRVAEVGRLTERFSKAVEMLGSDKLSVRLGGIYALERIARDSLKDHWTVIEVLTAFVREQSKEEYLKSQHSDRQPSYYDVVDSEFREPYKIANRLREDIQAALTVIGRREWADLERPHQAINLMDAFLAGTFLLDANLKRANLFQTKLSQSILYKADLRNAVLGSAILVNADLSYAKLHKATLIDANLSGADLRTSIGLTWEQISTATIDEKTKLPPELEERRKAVQAKKAAASNQQP